MEKNGQVLITSWVVIAILLSSAAIAAEANKSKFLSGYTRL